MPLSLLYRRRIIIIVSILRHLMIEVLRFGENIRLRTADGLNGLENCDLWSFGMGFLETRSSLFIQPHCLPRIRIN